MWCVQTHCAGVHNDWATILKLLMYALLVSCGLSMPLHTHATEHVSTAVLSGLPLYMHTMHALTQMCAYKYAP